MIYAGVKGYLDELPINKVGTFETELLRSLRTSKTLLDTIRKEEKLTDATETELKDVIQTVRSRLL